MKSKAIATILSTFILSFAMAGAVRAECTTPYGGSTTCVPLDLTINKQVQDPVTGDYVENVTTAKFSQGDNVNFKLIVSNTSGQTLTAVKITDRMPDNLEILDVQANWTNATNSNKEYIISDDKKSVEFLINDLSSGQTMDMYIMAKLVGAYPTGDTFCRDNWANVTSTERPQGDTNFARLCVAQKVAGAAKLPVAGVEDLVMVLPFITTGLGGIALLKKRS